MAGDETDLVFESYEEADSFVRQYEVESGYRHIRKKSRTTTANDVSSLEGHRLICKDWSQKGPTNRTDCVFISLYNEVRECMHGTKRKKKVVGKQRKMVAQSSKKMGCKAKIIIKSVLEFPEYKLTDVTTKHKRVLLLKRLKEEFSAETLRRLKILVQIQPDHTDHIVGEAAEFIQPLDSTLVQYIKGKVTDGVKNVDNMLSLINEKNSSSNIRSSNRRFYPTRKTVYNIMYNEINSVRHTKNDQVNTALFIEERKKDLTDALFFRPASDPDSDTEEAKSLLFVYQSSFQQEIVRKYASEVALLDATYNTCKFELPLYMLAIQTNCGFVVIASFIVGKDSKDQVEEALDMIKSWNPSWKPKSFLTDYDRREIGAIEKVFAGSKVYLCQFHVQQAWKRWVSANKELSIEDKNYLLKTLREIRESSTHAICEERMKTLRESRVFNSNQKLRGWLETRWLPENERWVDYFRGSMTIRNDTTNGLEVQHRVLKENYLKKHGFGGTLLSVIQVLLEKYFPAMEIRYKESNIKSLDVSKAYNDQVPEFLRNRPKLFVDHCIRRMPPKVGALASEDFNFHENDCCTVVSADSGEVYTIKFKEMYPDCSCPDFQKKHWPCKHLLGVISAFPNYSWDHLNSAYTDQACFILDLSVGIDNTVSTENIPIDKDYVRESEHSYAVPTEHDHDIEKGSLNARNKCLDVVKEITNHIYCLDNIDVLDQAFVMLKNTNNLLEKSVPRIGNLPIRQKKRRQKMVRKKKASAATGTIPVKEPSTYAATGTIPAKEPSTSAATGTIPAKEPSTSAATGTIPAKEPSTHTVLGENNKTQDMDENERVLHEIWAEDGSEELIMEVGPYKLTRNSFHFLKSQLSDELIDAYLQILVKGTNVHHVCCTTATEIFCTGDGARHGYLRSTALNGFDKIICPVNEGGHHWVLVIVEPEQKKLIYVNPLGELKTSCQRILQYWYQFLQERHQLLGIRELLGDWTIEKINHSRQLDGDSCGLFTLKFAELYLNKLPLIFKSRPRDILAERIKIGTKILSSATRLLIGTREAVADVQFNNNDDSCRLLEENYEPLPVKRGKKKRKRSSFVYPTPKLLKTRKCKRGAEQLYCVCKRKDDGRKYWQCEHCQEWFHPVCIGFKEEEEPKEFICVSCLDLGDGDVEFTGESVSSSLWEEKYEEVMDAMHETFLCDDTDCNDEQHQRHHDFTKDPSLFIKLSERKHLFGRRFFSSQDEENIYEKVKSDLYTVKRDSKYPVTGLKIETIKGLTETSSLGKQFTTFKMIANKYILHVLVKEVMATTLCIQKGFPYEAANKFCQETEVDLHEALRKLKKNDLGPLFKLVLLHATIYGKNKLYILNPKKKRRKYSLSAGEDS